MSFLRDRLSCLPKLSDPKFLAVAWSQYLRTCVDGYGKLVVALTECLETDALDDDRRKVTKHSRSSWMDACREIATEILQRNGIPLSALVGLEQGYTTALDVATQLVFCGEYYSDIDMDDCWSAMEDTDLGFPLKTAGGSIAVSGESAIDIMSNIKAAMHSAITMQAATAAAQFNDADTRITYFKDTVAASYENVYDDLSATFKVYYDMLTVSWDDPITFFAQLYQMMNMGKQESDAGFTLNDSDFSNYAGVNPLTVIDWSVAQQVSAEFWDITGQAIGSLVNSITSLFGWSLDQISAKIKPVYNAIVLEDPLDLSINDGNSTSPTIDRFGIQKTNKTISTTSGCFSPAPLWSHRDEIVALINSQAGQWYKVDNGLYELLFKLKSVDGMTNEIADSTHRIYRFSNLKFDYMLKIKPINPHVLYDALEYAHFSPEWIRDISPTAVYPNARCGIKIPSINKLAYVLSSNLELLAEYLALNNNPIDYIEKETEWKWESDAWSAFSLGYQFAGWFNEEGN